MCLHKCNLWNTLCSLWSSLRICETGRSLRSSMNGHILAIKNGGQSLLHRHFHQPDHSVDNMRVQILEKIYNSLENPTPAYHYSQNKRAVLDKGAWYSQTVCLQ